MMLSIQPHPDPLRIAVLPRAPPARQYRHADTSTRRLPSASCDLPKASLARPQPPPPSLSPAMTLPPELLIQIFEHCGPAHARSLSHVCRFWRAAALATPALWTRIPTWAPLAAVHAYLVRSCGAPLAVDLLPLDSENAQSVHDALREHTDHIRTLSYFDTRADYGVAPHPIPEALWDPAPQLEDLSITLPSSHPYASLIPPPDCPQHLFAGHAPRLRAFALTRVPPALLPQHTFPSLTHLSLSSAILPAASIAPLLALLARAPALETLALAHIRRRAAATPDAAGTAAAPVRLARLRSLVVRDVTGAFAADLLRALELPAPCAVALEDVERAPVADLAWLRQLPPLAPLHALVDESTRERLEEAAALRLVLDIKADMADDALTFDVALVRRPPSGTTPVVAPDPRTLSTDQDGAPAFRLAFSMPPSFARLQAHAGWTRALLAYLPPSAVQRVREFVLHVDGQVPEVVLGEGDVSWLMHELQRVQTMWLCGEGAGIGVWEVLRPGRGEGEGKGGEDEDAVPLRRLDTLCVEMRSMDQRARRLMGSMLRAREAAGCAVRDVQVGMLASS